MDKPTPSHQPGDPNVQQQQLQLQQQQQQELQQQQQLQAWGSVVPNTSITSNGSISHPPGSGHAPISGIPEFQIPFAPVPPPHNLIPQHLQPWMVLPNHANMATAAAAIQSAAAMNSNNVMAGTTSMPQHLTGTPLWGTPGHPALVLPNLLPPSNAVLPTTTTAIPMIPTAAAIPPPIAIPRPVFTVQDRPLTPPVYNGVNPHYPGLRVVNAAPPMFAVDQFLTDAECDGLIAAAADSFQPAPVVGKGAGEVSPSRTSSTCYLAREDVPSILQKVCALTGQPAEHCELPQVGRYLQSQQYLQHFDAFDLSTEDGLRFAQNGGQRIITVLIYLNTISDGGGGTRFPALDLQVAPRKGTALVFFPATLDGLLDQLALHAALPAIATKYVSQIWIRQAPYHGQPSVRLPAPLLTTNTAALPATTTTSALQ